MNIDRLVCWRTGGLVRVNIDRLSGMHGGVLSPVVTESLRKVQKKN